MPKNLSKLSDSDFVQVQEDWFDRIKARASGIGAAGSAAFKGAEQDEPVSINSAHNLGKIDGVLKIYADKLGKILPELKEDIAKLGNAGAFNSELNSQLNVAENYISQASNKILGIQAWVAKMLEKAGGVSAKDADLKVRRFDPAKSAAMAAKASAANNKAAEKKAYMKNRIVI
jgi:hypothetical protein